MKIHPSALAMPKMLPAEFDALKADIREKGLLVPIETHKGLVIDGRHRLLACKELDIEPDIVEVDLGDISAPEYVWSVNATRRHLTASQKAAIAVDLLPELQKAAKERQGTRTDMQHPDKINRMLSPGNARDKAAAIVGVSPSYVSDAARIKRESPCEFAEIKSGTKQLSEVKKQAHVANNSGDNEWYTPKEYIDAARKVMGSIDLDPASCKAANKIVGASGFFTEKDNGLTREWIGTVFMNPPYAQPLIGEFSEKLAASVESGTVTQAVVLVNNATETKWFQRLASVAAAICFPAGRVRFWHPDKTAAPLQGQAVVYAGNRVKTFAKAFKEFGFVMEVHK